MPAEISLGGGNELLKLRRELGRIPDDVQKRLRPVMRQEGRPILAEARRRADWSTRIPSAIRLSTSFSRRRAGLHVQVDRRRAPHARNWEDLLGRGEARWPVFGNRAVWASQRARSFLEPAVIAHSLVVVARINQAINQAVKDAGFR